MKALLRTPLLAFLAVSLCVPSHAGSATDVMFSSTQPTTGNTASMNYAVGGSYSLRVPQKSFQLFQADPPRFSAGCGGIDLHLGSFSFISMDAFKDMLRKVAQAAPGYFLHLAIQTMCSPCSNLLTWLQGMMADLNSGALNSCQIAKKVANSVFTSHFGPMVEDTAAAAKAYKEASENTIGGQFSDWAQSIKERVGGISSSLAGMTAGSQQARDVNLKHGSGNSAVFMLVRSDAYDKFDVSVFSGAGEAAAKAEMTNIFMSVYGSTVRKVVEPEESGPGENPPAKEYLGSFSVMDLYNGSAVTTSLMNFCKTGMNPDDVLSCQTVDQTSWSNYIQKKGGPSDQNFSGTLLWAHSILFGNFDQNVPSIGDTGLLAKVRNGGSLTKREQQFLSVAPAGSLTYLREVKHSERALQNVGRLLEKQVALSAAYEIARLLQSIYSTAVATNDARLRNASGVIPGSTGTADKFIDEKLRLGASVDIPKHVVDRATAFDRDVTAFGVLLQDSETKSSQFIASRVAALRAITPYLAYNASSGKR